MSVNAGPVGDYRQVPITQDGRTPVQITPQLPQSCVEFCKSTHIIVAPDGQSVVPAEHPHVPELHTSLYEHELPHEPQLRGEVWRFVHDVVPLVVHKAIGGAHPHDPELHV